jgi:tetratricopeptide (TPR) repeat protein
VQAQLLRAGDGHGTIGAQADIDRAQTLWNEGHQAEAEALLLDVLKRSEGQPGFEGEWAQHQACDKLGRLYLTQKRWDQAHEVLALSAQDLDAFNEEHQLGWACPYQALGALYAATDEPSRALGYLIRAADTEHDSTRVQLDVVIPALSAGDGHTATRFLDRVEAMPASSLGHSAPAPTLEPAQIAVLRGFALLLQRDYASAEQHFLLAHDTTGGRAGASAGLGHLAIVDQRYPQATELLELAVRLGDNALDETNTISDPTGIVSDPRSLYVRASYSMACLGQAWIASNQGRHEAAMPWYDRVLEQDPAHLLATLGRGNALVGLERQGEAQQVFERALERYPDNPYVLAELGLISYHRGDVTAAEQLFEQALAKDDGRYTCPHEGLGLVYLQQGRTEEARASFQHAIDLNPDIEFAKYNGLAKILMEEGELDGARALLRKSIANYPHDDEARALLEGLDAALEAVSP